jgi:hypothetical protein
MGLDGPIEVPELETPGRVLPSESRRPGDPRPAGFQDAPDRNHLDSASEALTALVDAASMSATAGRPLKVCFCNVRYAPGLPFNLYGFALQGVDEQTGALRDPIPEERELKYALVVNHPVELQRETALAFLFDLVQRQAPYQQVVSGARQIDELPQLTTEADATSAETSTDLMRFGWSTGAEALKRRAADFGYYLELRYQRDPFPTREETTQRIPALRRLYDENDVVRSAVDKTVSLVTGHGPELRASGQETIRLFAQQSTVLSGLREFMNHTARDAHVCGNGYAQMGVFGGLPFVRCLPPERVEILGDKKVALHQGDGDTAIVTRVLHMRGLEQLDSPYGISDWEPLLQQLEVAANTRKFVDTWKNRDLPPAQREELRRSERMAEYMERHTKERVDRLTEYPRLHLPEPVASLYFRGQERYA